MKVWMVTVLSAAVLLGLPATGTAQQYGGEAGSLEATDTTPGPGGLVTMSGSGFAPGSPVVLTIESTPMRLGTATADENGSFSQTVRIPENVSPGKHVLKATGVTPDGATRVLERAVTVEGPSQSRARQVMPFFLVGLLALVVVGVLLLVRARA